MTGVEYGSDRWNELVEISRKAHDTAAWILGDCILEIEPVEDAGWSTAGKHDRIRLFAAELGVSYDSVRQARLTCNAWPTGKRNPQQTFGAHRALNAHPSRFSIIQGLTLTLRDARKVMQEYRAKNPLNGLTGTERLEAQGRLDAGELATTVARDLGVSVTTVHRVRRQPRHEELYRRVLVGGVTVSQSEADFVKLNCEARGISESAYIRDLIAEDIRRAHRKNGQLEA